MTFLKSQRIRSLVDKNDWPRFLEEKLEVYEREELDKLFKACNAAERLWYEFFLMTPRARTGSHALCMADVNLSRSTVTVRYQSDNPRAIRILHTGASPHPSSK